MATLTATGQEKVRAGYDPLPAGFRQVPYNKLDAMEAAIDEKKTVAILIEPIQAEGGVIVPHETYMLGLREICDQRRILLIFDEVQTGMGRTGKLFGYENFGVKPDILTLAKALGAAAPGCLLAHESRNSFGRASCAYVRRNPVACAPVWRDAAAQHRALKIASEGNTRPRARALKKLVVYPGYSARATHRVELEIDGKTCRRGMPRRLADDLHGGQVAIRAAADIKRGIAAA